MLGDILVQCNQVAWLHPTNPDIKLNKSHMHHRRYVLKQQEMYQTPDLSGQPDMRPEQHRHLSFQKKKKKLRSHKISNTSDHYEHAK